MDIDAINSAAYNNSVMGALRRGKDFYTDKYDAVMKLVENGVPLQQIAQQTSLSYSCVYHWAKKLRKPGTERLTVFFDILKEKGPKNVAELKDEFPKHNEIFLTCKRRGFPIKRFVTKTKLGDHGTWYYVDGHEQKLEEAITTMMKALKTLKETLERRDYGRNIQAGRNQ